MLLKNWLAGMSRKQPLSRRFTRRKWHGDLRPAVERLEDRTLLAAAFGDQAIISSGADGALSVFAMDVDGDGDMDVLSASAEDDKIAWYENDGSQNFTERTISTTADRAHDLFVADMDGDGDIDVLSASMNDDTIAWYENDGSQNFSAHTISTSAVGAREVFAADVDGDGDIDVLSVSFGNDTIAWYENDGSQNFSEHVVSTAADGPHAVFATDVDGDGDIDVLSASIHDDKIAWYENDGSQNFSAHTISTAADEARRVFAADVDGDGDIDVLSASVGDDKIAWYENDGSQNFTERTISTVANGARCVDASDLDGDGDLDVLSASLDDDKVAWYENDGSQNFTERIISTAADGAVTVFAADVDGDGDLDVLSASANDDKIAWYENNATPTLDPIGDLTIDEDAPEQTIDLTGITAGGGESQPLRLHASNSLISRYDLDGDGLDSSGFSKHSVAGIASPTDNRHSESDTALAFNGTTDELAFNYQFPFNEDADRSLSFWMKAPADGHSAVFWGRENDTNQHRFHIYLNLTSATLGVDYSASNGTHHDLFAPSRGNLAPFTPDQWVFVALTREANTYSLSIDGTLVSTATDESPALPSGTGWKMAGRGGNHFNGSLDEVRFYDRALTSNEVAAIYEDKTTSFSPHVTYDGSSSSGQIAFEPVANEFGVSTTVVTVEDGGLDGDLATTGDNATFSQSFDVTVNDLPLSVADNYSTNEAEQLVVAAAGVLANDSDSEDDPLTAVLVTDVSDGTLNLASDGSFTYTSDADFYGTDSFTYKANDGSGDGNTVTVDVTVNAVNDAPDVTAPADSSVDEDADLAVSGFTAFDIDVDTALGFVRSVPGTIQDKNGIGTGFTHRLPGSGSALAEQDANIEVDLATGQMLVTSTRVGLVNSMNLENAEDPGLLLEGIGTDDFVTSMLIRDAWVLNPSDQISIIVGSSVAQTVRAVIHSGNHFIVTRNNGGPDDNWFSGANSFLSGDDIRITLIRSSQKWKMTWTNLTDPARNGESPEFDTPWLDDETDLHVGLHVASPNTDATFTAKIDEFFVETATAETFSATLSAGDGMVSLAETDGLSFTSGDGSSDASMEFSGTLSRINAAVETVTYRGNQDFNGGDTVSLSIDDGGQHGLGGALSTAASFDVTVNPVNDPPVILSLPDSSLEEDGSIHNDGTILDNFVSDIDSDTTTTEFRIVNFNEISADFGVTIEMAADSGSFADRSDNTIHVHPADDFNGSTLVTIEARDAQGDVSAQQSFTLTVTAVNDPPVAVVDHFPIDEDETLTVVAPGILANDSDTEDDSLTAELVADVTNGTLTLASDGGFTYIPDAGFHGWEIFTYRANDGSEGGIPVPVIIGVAQHPEIHGSLVHDLNGDGTLDAGEPGLGGWTVFLDTSDDGILDAGEISTTTAVDDPATTTVDERGDYSFVDLTPGDYTVAWVTPAGWQATTSSQSMTLAAGEVRQDVDVTDQFIISATPTVTAVSFADDGSGDTVTIGPNGTNVEMTVNGNVVVRKPASELTSITVNGSGDDDTLIVDLGGLDASLGFAVNLTFNGNGDGSDNDTLQLINGSASNIAYSFTNAADGTITIDSGSIEFSGLEPILDNLMTDHREFTFATTDDVVTLSDDGTSDNNLMTLSSVSSSETVTFTNPGTSMGIHLGSGDDSLTVTSLDDGFAGTLTLNGEGGDDVIDASAVSVAIKQNGSGGNDILTGGSGNDTLNGGSGSDSLEGGAGNDKLQGQGTSYDTLSGGPGDDTLDGGDGYDRISESADVDFTATDSSLAGLGTDTLINIQLVQLFGGSTDNTIDTSAFTGRAFLNGSGGNDILTGGGWYDRIFGGSGRDLITGGTSLVDPGTGQPTYDVLRGQGGNNDTLIGGDGADKLNGGAGHDSLVGGGGDDVLTGESGDDTIDGGEGTDRLYERANVDMTLTDASLSGGLGSDDLTSIETAYLKGGNSNNRLNASAFSGDVTLIGVGGADTLKGGGGNDMINGRSGDDSITGGDGNDTLLGMRGADVLNGGVGNDWLDGGTQDDKLSGWTGDDELYGRSENDILVGGEGNDSLYGASGDDILQGDDGKTDTDHTRDDDRLDGGADSDTVRGGGGSDTKLDDASEVDENFAYWAEWVDAV
ncbi:FG-GAP-like repeat-containing protein [Planctomycetaceae bacterium]|nr:FG-GAP-like repeat-containing protein [Planctomycetaceae bacterium]